MTKEMKYYIKNVLNNSVVLIVSHSRLNALKKARDYFNTTQVRILSVQ